MTTEKFEIINALKIFADLVGGECTIIVERGTASISEENVRLLSEMTGGKIRVVSSRPTQKQSLPNDQEDRTRAGDDKL